MSCKRTCNLRLKRVVNFFFFFSLPGIFKAAHCIVKSGSLCPSLEQLSVKSKRNPLDVTLKCRPVTHHVLQYK